MHLIIISDLCLGLKFAKFHLDDLLADFKFVNRFLRAFRHKFQLFTLLELKDLMYR